MKERTGSMQVRDQKNGMESSRAIKRFLLFFWLLPLGCKLFLSAPSTVIYYFGAVRESELLMTLGQLCAVLSDIALPVILCCGSCAVIRERMGSGRPLGWRGLPVAGGLLLQAAAGLGLGALLCRIGLSDLTLTQYRVQLPIYLLAACAELIAELLLLGILVICCRLCRGAPPIFAKGSAYRRICLGAVWGRLGLQLLARLGNGAVDAVEFAEIVDAYGFYAAQTVLVFLQAFLLPLLYFGITVFAVRQLGLHYSEKIALTDAIAPTGAGKGSGRK